MPSFDPSYYQQRLILIEDEFQQTDMARQHYNDFWLNLRPSWADHAGQQLDSRNMTPLLDSYANSLKLSEQHITAKQQGLRLFEELQQQLMTIANKHQEIELLNDELNIHTQHCREKLNTTRQLSTSLDELNQQIEQQTLAANSQTNTR